MSHLQGRQARVGQGRKFPLILIARCRSGIRAGGGMGVDLAEAFGQMPDQPGQPFAGHGARPSQAEHLVRRGDPGTAQQFASAEDELVRRFLPRPLPALLRTATKPLGGTLFARAQARAQKLAFRQRQSVLRSDTWLDESLAFTTNL